MRTRPRTIEPMTQMPDTDWLVFSRALDRANPWPVELDHLADLADAQSNQRPTLRPRARPRTAPRQRLLELLRAP
jgi:hypothetical protein